MSGRECDLFMIGEISDVQIENVYLTFMAQDETYGVNVAHVTEVAELPWVSEALETYDFTQGIIDLRGEAVPIVDGERRRRSLRRKRADRSTIITLNLDDASIGLIVDQVTGVISLSDRIREEGEDQDIQLVQ